MAREEARGQLSVLQPLTRPHLLKVPSALGRATLGTKLPMQKSLEDTAKAYSTLESINSLRPGLCALSPARLNVMTTPSTLTFRAEGSKPTPTFPLNSPFHPSSSS
jgi:hypothetical protein